jgi:hypothetical protein
METLSGFLIAGVTSLLAFQSGRIVEFFLKIFPSRDDRVEIVMPDGRKFLVAAAELTAEKISELAGVGSSHSQ